MANGIEGKWWHVDRDMIFVKLGFLLYGAQKSAYIPYMTIFLTSVGFNLKQVGVIQALKQTGFIIGSLFWAMVADKTQARRTIVILVCVMFAVFNTSLPFVSAVFGPGELNKCPASTNLTQTDSVMNSGLIAWSSMLYLFTALNFAVGFFDQGIVFVKEISLHKIKRSKRNATIGRQFLFATIGFGTANTVSGQILEYFPRISVTCYLAVFLSSLLLVVLWTLVMHILYKDDDVADDRTDAENPADEHEFCRVLWYTLKDCDLQMHFASVFVFGFAYSIYLAYFFLFIKSLNAPNLLIGLTIASGSTSGFVASALSTWLHRKLGGVWNVYIFTMIVGCIRYVMIHFLVNPWVVIPCQLLLHGVCVTLVFINMLEYLKQKQMPSSVRATTVGIQGCMSDGLGSILGRLFGGMIYHVYGARALFLIAALICGVWGLVVACYRILVWRKKTNVENSDIIIENFAGNKVVENTKF